MKHLTLALVSSLTAVAVSVAEPPTKPQSKNLTEAEKAKAIEEHLVGAEEVSIDQDKQSANTRDLIIEQTDPKVIALLREVESLMGKTTDSLEDGDTGGDTIAMQTEIIEKIYEAAKQRQSSSPSQGSQKSMGAMLEMMGQMMGKEPGQKPGKDKDGPSEQGGEGSTGDSDSANTENNGPNKGKKPEERRIPRAAGSSGQTLPPEFQKALDGYNRKTPSE